jgi:hypothetical protein
MNDNVQKTENPRSKFTTYLNTIINLSLKDSQII